MIKMKQWALIGWIVAILATGWSADVLAKAKYQEVDVAKLAANPQNYWARGIIFTDELKDVSKSGIIRIAEKDYIAISTEELGLCYLLASLYDVENPPERDRSYVFSGTVLQEGRGMFRKRRYQVVIHSFEPLAVGDSDELADWKALISKAVAAEADGKNVISELTVFVQEQLMVLAANKGRSFDDLLKNPGSDRKDMLNTVRGAVYQWIEQQQTTGPELLTELVVDALAESEGHYRVLLSDVEMEPAERTVLPEPTVEEPPMETEPVVLEENEPPPEVTETLPAEPETPTVEPVDDEDLESFVSSAVETVTVEVETGPAEEEMDEFLDKALEDYTEEDIYAPIGL